MLNIYDFVVEDDWLVSRYCIPDVICFTVPISMPQIEKDAYLENFVATYNAGYSKGIEQGSAQLEVIRSAFLSLIS